MIRPTLLFAAGLFVTPATAEQSTVARLEVVGNYAGRMISLTIDGKLVFQGYGHLEPPGVTWTHAIQPGPAPAPIELTLEPCPEPFRGEVARDGATHTLVIQGCEIKLLAD